MKRTSRISKRAVMPMLLTALFIVSSLLVACGATATPVPPTQPAAAQPPVAEATTAPVALACKELNIWTWGIYCPDFATQGFEEKYGVKVNCTFYHGNEELWSKIQAGHEGLDIIQPSHHMIVRFAEAGLLEPIDTAKIPSYADVFESFKGQAYAMYQGSQYSVPYTFGINGICYRTDFVTGTVDSWASCWDAKYSGHIGWSRNPDDAVQAVALYLGMDVSKLDEDTDAKLVQIKAAMDQQNPLLLKRFESLEEEKNLLATGDLWITSSDDGLCRQMKLDGQPVELVVPKEGVTAWIDQFAIMADAPNKDCAYAWIDYMLSPDVAAQMIKEIGYMVVNQKAADALSPELKAVMNYTPAQTALFFPMPALKPETTAKIVQAYQDERGQ
jgi:spermidine/putrescine transport system substrate-binding protein